VTGDPGNRIGIIFRMTNEETNAADSDTSTNTAAACLLGLLLALGQHGRPLRRRPLRLAFSRRLVLRPLRVHLVLEHPLALLLGFGTMDMLDKRSLVLKRVALAEVVELVIEMLVNLTACAVLDEKPPKDLRT